MAFLLLGAPSDVLIRTLYLSRSLDPIDALKHALAGANGLQNRAVMVAPILLVVYLAVDKPIDNFLTAIDALFNLKLLIYFDKSKVAKQVLFTGRAV